MEIEYDLVDSHDDIICIGTEKDAKKLGLFTRSVHILLVDKQGKIMVCKRPSTTKRYANKITSSAGGHVEQGENYKVAATRELQEELGITTFLKDIGRFDVITSKERAIHHLFIGKAKKVLPDPNEIVNYYFFIPAIIKRDMKLHSRKYCEPFHKAFALYSTVTKFSKIKNLG